MTIVALICARGGSKGVPGKNIRRLAGKPLVVWAIEHARAVARIDRVIVSTDSEEIAAVASEAGAEVPFFRPADLSGDASPEREVWRHALEHLRSTDGVFPDVLVVVPATAPLRMPSDLERCLDEFEKGEVDVVITVTDAHRSPYFNMVMVDAGGRASLVIPPDGPITRRQDAQVVYDMATVAYVVRPDFAMSQSGLFQGRVRSVHVPRDRALDIDSPLDFRIAECLMGQR